MGGLSHAHRATLAVVATAAAAFLSTGCATPNTGRVRDAHLFWNAPPAEREIANVEQFGPFWEKVETKDGSVRRSIRPLIWSKTEAAGGQVSAEEILYPLYSQTRRGDSVSTRFLVFFSLDKDVDNPSSQERSWYFPFWFSGTSREGEPYSALFPFYGTIREMYWDEINFTMFPFWVTWDRAGNHTWSCLWPFIQRQKGPERDAWRFFPFWARSSRIGDYDAGYFMWPIWTHADYYRLNPGSDWMLWPIVGRVDRANEDTWMVLPPLFTFAYGRGKTPEYRKVNCPWPLVRIYDDKDVHRRVYFPFSMHRWSEDGKVDNRDILWPFWNSRRLELSNRAVRENSLWPVYKHSLTERKDKESGERSLDEDYLRFWPLYSRRYDPEHRLVRVPDLRWNKREGVLEQLLLGMFTLYTRGEKSGAEGERPRVDHELLWGLARRGYGEGYSATRLWPFYDSKEENGRWHWSLLGGLLGRSGDSEKSSWRFLWFFGGGDPAPTDE